MISSPQPKHFLELLLCLYPLLQLEAAQPPKSAVTVDATMTWSLIRRESPEPPLKSALLIPQMANTTIPKIFFYSSV